MLVVETIAKIRRLSLVQGKSIKEICRELRISRKVVRKSLRSDATEFRYERQHVNRRAKLTPDWSEPHELDREDPEKLIRSKGLERGRLMKSRGPYRRHSADRRRQREILHHHRPAACSIRRGCEVIDLPRSTFYYRIKAKTTKLSDAELVTLIEDIQDELPCYGYRRVTHELCRRGHLVNHKRVARVMRTAGLGIKPRRRYVRTTDSSHDSPIYPNLYRNVIPDQPDMVWVADFTYIRIATGFCYLAVILDACSRKVIGYALSRRLDTPLALAALRSALTSRRPPPGCVHHTDRGCQYASETYRKALEAAGLRGSMSAIGDPAVA